MTYDVYAGGFYVVLADLKVGVKADRYTLSLDSATRGFLDKIVGWKGLFATKGWALKDRFQPEEHMSDTKSGDDVEKKVYRYGKNGSFLSYRVTDNHSSDKDKDIDKSLTEGTTDALSATFAAMNRIAKEGTCNGSADVFDGSRRYELVFREAQRVTLEKTKYNVFSGPAVECTVEVKPLAGKWHEKPRGWMSIQEQGRKAGTMPTIWFAQVKDGEPAVPVKIRVRTDYGVLFMHLRGYTAGQG